MNETAKTRKTILVRPETWARIKAKAALRGVPVSRIAEEALESYIETKEQRKTTGERE